MATENPSTVEIPEVPTATTPKTVVEDLEPVFQLPDLGFIEDSENIHNMKVEVEGQTMEVVFDLADTGMETQEPTQEEPNVEIDLNEIARAVPNKMAFKIGEVSDITGIKSYVLRYWESEFDALAPQKSAFNQRMYSKKDVETVLLIKKLLYNEKFSIAGAKLKIRELRKELKVEKQKIEKEEKFAQAIAKVKEIQSDIAALRKIFLDA